MASKCCDHRYGGVMTSPHPMRTILILRPLVTEYGQLIAGSQVDWMMNVVWRSKNHNHLSFCFQSWYCIIYQPLRDRRLSCRHWSITRVVFCKTTRFVTLLEVWNQVLTIYHYHRHSSHYVHASKRHDRGPSKRPIHGRALRKINVNFFHVAISLIL